MRMIALEEHFLPQDVATAAGIDPASVWGLFDALGDTGDKRLEVMDKAGIDVQILSVPNAGIQKLGAERATALSRELNDRMAAVIAAHPGRFRAFASLPMCAPDAAADELARAVQELGFVGVLVAGQTNGAFLDDPSMRPVLQAAERLDVPVYLHPAAPPQTVFDAYFSGLDPGVAARLSTSGWGWHVETGMHVLRMAATGTFERFPGLQVIVGHMGENLPFSLARADEQLGPVVNLSTSVAETLQQHLWITTCGYTTTPPLLCALTVFGADRMMFSVDYPFSDGNEATEFLTDAPLGPGDRARIAHLNAEALLKI
ncbi:MAG: amidohydrolase [Solirubrobacterales bacterium]|nr:amidohydrolase [Solirubrobacterales bacterium]